MPHRLNACLTPFPAAAAALGLAALLAAAPVAAQPNAPDRPLRVASFNIHHAAGNDECTPPAPSTPPAAECALNLERIAEVVRAIDPDVIGFQEVDRFWGRSGNVDQAEALSRALRMHACYGANLDHPADNHAAQPHQYGALILSKRPILSCENTHLPKANPSSEQRGLAHAVINVRGVRVHVYNTHLHTAVADRAVQVTAIDSLIADHAPALLVGDFNARPTETTLAPLQARLQDAWAAAGAGDGFTFPAAPAATPNRRIDYIFASRNVTVSAIEVHITAESSIAADHYPLAANVLVPGSEVGNGKENGNGPEPAKGGERP